MITVRQLLRYNKAQQEELRLVQKKWDADQRAWAVGVAIGTAVIFVIMVTIIFGSAAWVHRHHG